MRCCLLAPCLKSVIHFRNATNTEKSKNEWVFRQGRKEVHVASTTKLLSSDVSTMYGTGIAGYGSAHVLPRMRECESSIRALLAVTPRLSSIRISPRMYATSTLSCARVHQYLWNHAACSKAGETGCVVLSLLFLHSSLWHCRDRRWHPRQYPSLILTRVLVSRRARHKCIRFIY